MGLCCLAQWECSIEHRFNYAFTDEFKTKLQVFSIASHGTAELLLREEQRPNIKFHFRTCCKTKSNNHAHGLGRFNALSQNISGQIVDHHISTKTTRPFLHLLYEIPRPCANDQIGTGLFRQLPG